MATKSSKARSNLWLFLIFAVFCCTFTRLCPAASLPKYASPTLLQRIHLSQLRFESASLTIVSHLIPTGVILFRCAQLIGFYSNAIDTACQLLRRSRRDIQNDEWRNLYQSRPSIINCFHYTKNRMLPDLIKVEVARLRQTEAALPNDTELQNRIHSLEALERQLRHMPVDRLRVIVALCLYLGFSFALEHMYSLKKGFPEKIINFSWNTVPPAEREDTYKKLEYELNTYYRPVRFLTLLTSILCWNICSFNKLSPAPSPTPTPAGPPPPYGR